MSFLLSMGTSERFSKHLKANESTLLSGWLIGWYFSSLAGVDLLKQSRNIAIIQLVAFL